MESISFAGTAFSLLPPAIAILLAILTRHVLLSLGTGIVVGILMLNHFSPMDSISHLSNSVASLFFEDGGLNTYNLNLLGFLLLLGAMTTVMTASGASRAFAQWARTRVRTRRNSMLMAAVLGLIIFIDDYFTSLAVGSVSRPITDSQNISRTKLAYILDSTAAPACVISPLSSWGAYIIALLAGILSTHNVEGISAITAFIFMVPMNFYAIFAIAMVFAVIFLDLDIGRMRSHEAKAAQGELFDASLGVPPGTAADVHQSDYGQPQGLIVPILVLIFATIFLLVGTGVAGIEGKVTILGALENAVVDQALIMGAAIGLSTAIVYAVKSKLTAVQIVKACLIGAKSMLPAVTILLFAWTIGGVISELGTGGYFADMTSGTIPVSMLPALIFVLSGIMAFSTGTSWGTFGIMLPIAASMIMGAEPNLLLAMLSAVLAGAVFGDHCSPISDTTILSSTGANCHHIEHVTTQLPYALIGAVISILGYLALGITDNMAVGFITALISFIVAVVLMKRYVSKLD